MAKKSDPGIMLVTSYLSLFAVNVLVVLVANLLVPQSVVLGTLHIPKVLALIHSMGTLALINAFAIPFINAYEKSRPKNLSTTDWMLIYFVINAVGVWLVTRFADQLGFGISSWFVAIILAVVLDFAQGAVMMQLEKTRTK